MLLVYYFLMLFVYQPCTIYQHSNNICVSSLMGMPDSNLVYMQRNMAKEGSGKLQLRRWFK